MRSGYVLIVDDDPGILTMVQEGLSVLGLHTITATNGEQALEAIRQNPPSAVIVDLMMPVKSGFSVILDLQNEPATQRIPIIVFSAMGDRQSTMDHLPGVVGVITKGRYSLSGLRALLVKAKVLTQDGAPLI